MRYRIKYWFKHGELDFVYVQKRSTWWPFWKTVTSVCGIERAKTLIERLKQIDKGNEP
jgi:hypothetical protein